jgi:hypothetical protein
MKTVDWYKSCAYNEPQKHLFHREARKRLKILAETLRLPRESYRIRSNKAGIAVSGEVTLHSTRLYVQVCQPATGADSGIMIRTCEGIEDYAGERNSFLPLRYLDEINGLAGYCQRVLDRNGGCP